MGRVVYNQTPYEGKGCLQDELHTLTQLDS